MLLRALNRWQAAGLHFSGSLAVIGLYLLLVFLAWYPAPYARIEGVQDVVLILVGVDVVLGPLLTLIVFNAAKASLRWDLTLILVVQLAALAWGVQVTYSQRPLYLAYSPDAAAFSLVAASEIEPGTPPAGLESHGWGGPLEVYVNTRKSGLNAVQLVELGRSSGRRSVANAQWYEALDGHWPELRANAQVNIEERLKLFPAMKPQIEAFLAQAGGSLADYAFITIEGRRKLGFLVFRQSDQSVAGLIAG
jgi:hypothetical protein